MNSNASTPQPGTLLSAAHHCLAAENFFSRAKELQQDSAEGSWKPTRFNRRFESILQRHYDRYMEWAHFHLQLAAVITEGSNLVVAHSRAAADPNTDIHRTYVAGEATAWDDFIAGRPLDSRIRWLMKPDPMDVEF